LIHKLSLSSPIFDIPVSAAPAMSAPLGPSVHGFAAAHILHTLTDRTESHTTLPFLHPTLAAAFTHDPSTPPRLFLACALTPYRHVTYEDSKGKVHSATEAALREGVKLGVQNHYLDGIPALFLSADLLQNPQVGGQRERMRIGMAPSRL
jgi:tRNA nucleotidyltransferase (CCA-adding enzyme)